jgi:hypothetical protein
VNRDSEADCGSLSRANVPYNYDVHIAAIGGTVMLCFLERLEKPLILSVPGNRLHSYLRDIDERQRIHDPT